MKLGEALLIRSDMQKKLAQLKERLQYNVKVQEGDTPSENPDTLLVEASRVISELSNLIARIHRTNALSATDTGEPMLELLIERDRLAMQHKLLIDMIAATNTDEERYSYREIKWDVTVSVLSLQKQADDIAMKLRDTNLRIQANNWRIELIDA